MNKDDATGGSELALCIFSITASDLTQHHQGATACPTLGVLHPPLQPQSLNEAPDLPEVGMEFFLSTGGRGRESTPAE